MYVNSKDKGATCQSPQASTPAGGGLRGLHWGPKKAKVSSKGSSAPPGSGRKEPKSSQGEGKEGIDVRRARSKDKVNIKGRKTDIEYSDYSFGSAEAGKKKNKGKKKHKYLEGKMGNKPGSVDLERSGSPPKKDKKKSKGTSDTTRMRSSSGEDQSSPSSESEDELYISREPETRKVTIDDFELLSVIGKGSFGKVMQVKKKDTGNIYAMKTLRKETVIAKKQVAHTKGEKSILQKIHHPFIIGLHYAFQTEGKLYMILDFVNGGELFYHLKREGRFAENRVRFYVAEIVSALAYLHSYDIVYRDLKPENILLDADGHIVITDFGLSKELPPNEGTDTFCGTPEYLAPEILKGQVHGTAVDWWSLGTFMYEMLTGLPPFYSQNVHIMYQQILHATLMYPDDVEISPEGRSLIEGLLTRDPLKRLGGVDKAALDIKSHPFFRPIDWAKLDRREIEPSFKPPVHSVHDLSQIDPDFTAEEAVDSWVEKSNMTQTAEGEAENPFKNFTWQNDHMEEQLNKTAEG